MYQVKINNQIMIEKAEFTACMNFIEQWMKEHPEKNGCEINLEFLGDN